MTRFSLAVAAVCLVASVTLSQEAPKPPAASQDEPAFPTRVELVTVDAVVVDGKGKAVPDLTKEDFTVLENGVPQAISSFEAVTLPATPPAGGERRRLPFSSNQEPEARQGRTFAVVFDDVHLSALQAQRAKAVVGEFLRTGVRDGDRVSLIATTGACWWSARMPDGRQQLMTILKRLDGSYVADSSPDRVTEYEAMRIMAFDDAEVGYQVQRRFDAYGAAGRERVGDRQFADSRNTTSAVGLIDPYVRARATDVYQQAVSRRKITIGMMARALRSLAETRGRKAMILVSQGFIYESDFKEMKEAVEASLRVNVPVYFIDTRGLKALPDFMTASFPNLFDVQDTAAVLADISREAEGADNIALDTGGFAIKNTNDLESGILRVSSESLAYYLLGYNPTDAARDGKFRRIEVKLAPAKAKGLKVRARRGYYAPRDVVPVAPRRDEDPEIVRALDSPFEKREVPVRVAAYSFDETLTSRANVLVVTEVDIRELDLREEEGRFKGSLAFLVDVQHRETGESYRNDQKIEMALLPETRQSLATTGYVISREFPLPAGGYQVRVVVRDLGNRRLGSVIHDFEVPALDAFRITSPILADTLESPEAATASARQPRPMIRVDRRFGQGSTLYVQFSVLGATMDQATHRPQVSSGYEIRRSDGSILRSAPATRITPTSLGALIRLHGINLATAPGEYELVLRVKDELADRSLEVREPFVVQAAAAAASGQR